MPSQLSNRVGVCVLLFQPTHLANFTQVQSIQYSCMEERERKGVLQLDVAGAAEVLHKL